MPRRDKKPPKNSMVEYLGDGLYAVFDGRGVWLHANDPFAPTDKVYLEPEVLKAFDKFLALHFDLKPREATSISYRKIPVELEEKKADEAAETLAEKRKEQDGD